MQFKNLIEISTRKLQKISSYDATDTQKSKILSRLVNIFFVQKIKE